MREMPARKVAAWLLGALAAGAIGAVSLGCGSAVDDRPPNWSFIWPAIIQPSCATASCHSAVSAQAGVVLEDKNTAWNTLTTRHFVIPNDTTGESEILQLMRATAVRRMPPDFPLPPANIQLIEKWIEKGALNN